MSAREQCLLETAGHGGTLALVTILLALAGCLGVTL